ncbi:hypothetical protein GCM10010289_83410 [Streptomyces violascens]|uniref:Uncharacterized protein n=1 Tax=Streptomyces violascens TaxID=67381 RepID=A0ABQ3QT20_9ACTN|nr:hypothetical protein GCM10010289_83410 [Streptomyces violascens]GHI40369.1 hypothetical protein Sviol_47770 [Streptomyces violascens]
MGIFATKVGVMPPVRGRRVAESASAQGELDSPVAVVGGTWGVDRGQHGAFLNRGPFCGGNSLTAVGRYRGSSRAADGDAWGQRTATSLAGRRLRAPSGPGLPPPSGSNSSARRPETREGSLGGGEPGRDQQQTREPGPFEGADPLLTVLPDSPVIDDDPQQDGRRMVTLRSPECATFSWDFYAAWVSSARPNSRA